MRPGEGQSPALTTFQMYHCIPPTVSDCWVQLNPALQRSPEHLPLKQGISWGSRDLWDDRSRAGSAGVPGLLTPALQGSVTRGDPDPPRQCHALNASVHLKFLGAAHGPHP